MVTGYVIRMFNPKDSQKRGSSFSHSLAEILTPEGITICLQFVLGEENSLVEYFRLYRCYNFYRLKIIDNGMLSFAMDSSKFD